MGKKGKTLKTRKSEAVEEAQNAPQDDGEPENEDALEEKDDLFNENESDESEQDEGIVLDTVDKLVKFDILEKASSLERLGLYDEPKDFPPLSEEEDCELNRLEDIVRVGDYHFLRGGLALFEIWQKKLYRKHTRYFSAYLADRFEFSRVRAYQLMTAASVYGYLSKHFDKDVLPKHIAPLLALQKTHILELPEVYQRSIEELPPGNKPSANKIKETIRQLAWEKKHKEKLDFKNDSDVADKQSNSESVKNTSPDFVQFQEDIEQIKNTINAMKLTTLRLLSPGPFWLLWTSELRKAKEILETITKDIEKTITGATRLAEKYENPDEEFSMIITKDKAKKMGIWGHPDFTFERSSDPFASKNTFIVTRKKRQPE